MTTELAGIRRRARDAQIRGASFHVAGVGEARVSSATMNLITADSPDAVIMAGFCGAADRSLETGDIHVADYFHVLDGSGTRRAGIAANADLASGLTAAALSSGCRVVTTASATVPTVAGVAAKSAVRASLGAASVNMEDYWAAFAARSAGVPFVSVRTVLDTADQELPPWISSYAESASRAALHLVTHPGRISALLKISRQAGLARRQLTRCLVATLDTLTPSQNSRAAVAQ